ncbi:MAG TPA: universal stress protein [Pirellulales bacterium]|nr:universal stress protein [Pirellulales bacterium]
MNATPESFQNILLATDFSESAATGLETAVSLARQCGAKLTVAHVIRDVSVSFAMLDYGTAWQALPEDLGRLQTELRDDAEQRLQSLLAEHQQTGVEIASQVLVGVPYIALIEAVQQNAFDLVVVGTRGMSAVKRVFVGSTATRLARACPVPVWIARQGLPGETQSILVPLDFSPIGDRLLATAAVLAKSLRAKLHLLHVYDIEELYGVPPISDDTRAELSYYRRRARRLALEKLEQSLEAMGLDHGTATLHVTQGVPHQAINATARKLDVGLILMGSIGRSGLSGLLIGNTAEKVLHTSDRSLLVVKPEGFAVTLPEKAALAAEPELLPVGAASIAHRRW